MATTYEAIATVTVGSGGAANIEFTSIPATYTDLVIYTSLRDSASTTSTNYGIRLNGLSTTIYSRKYVYGTGSSAGSATGSGEDQMFIGYSNSNTATANTFGNGSIYIPNYTSSASKSVSSDTVAETNGTTISMALAAGLAATSAAVTSVTVLPWTAPFLQYSTATLYGIKNS